METSGLALATWVADYDAIGTAYQLAERLSVALAAPSPCRSPASLIPMKQEPTAREGVTTQAN
ncbi:hypothetical protein KAM338_40610 [Aeromonas caviae]|nr:hypothetical protein AHML_15815 [Aeromonas hydrophila ML09-119]AZU48932.1 hypothetical protein C3B79_3180 [Aeromonas hydrophila]CAD7492059.1 hypothetical protein KBAD45_28220 [Aeromonas dhakensis]GKQ63884.1 hypothetical protein KAM338_40610 [Aeromonas caviae]CAD7511506.1 hypothetical protein KBAD50_14290 [Aeromonas dhakensis]